MGEQQATGIQLLGHREQLHQNREENDQRRKLDNISRSSIQKETSRKKTQIQLYAGSVGFVTECRRQIQKNSQKSLQDSSDSTKYRAGKLHQQQQHQEKFSKFSISEPSVANHEDLSSLPLILQASESFSRKHHLLHNGHGSLESTTVKALHNSVNCSASEDVPSIDQVVNGNFMNSTVGRVGGGVIYDNGRGGGFGDVEKTTTVTNNLEKLHIMKPSSKPTTMSNGIGSWQSNMLQRQFLLNNSAGMIPMVTSNGGVQCNELHLQSSTTTTTQLEPKNSMQRNNYAKRQSINKNEQQNVAKIENWMIEGSKQHATTTMSVLNNGGNMTNKSMTNVLKKSHSVSSLSLPMKKHSSSLNVTSLEVESMSNKKYVSTTSKSGGVFWEESCSDDEDSGFFLQENDSDADGMDDGCYHSFAGFRNYMMPERAICGETGTVRGMRNRVRAGIATFLHQTTGNKNFHQLEANKVVIYTTTTGIVRGTFQQCLKVKTILSTLLVSFEERDIFKCRAYQREMVDRLDDENVRVPQVFVEGYHLGDANVIEKLNECGRLRKILRPYKRANANKPCHKCGGYLLLLCSACNGSKKSLTRNQFSDSLAPLRCTKCDECGLIPCDLCCSLQPMLETTGKV